MARTAAAVRRGLARPFQSLWICLALALVMLVGASETVAAVPVVDATPVADRSPALPISAATVDGDHLLRERSAEPGRLGGDVRDGSSAIAAAVEPEPEPEPEDGSATATEAPPFPVVASHVIAPPRASTACGPRRVSISTGLGRGPPTRQR